jgi:hypothetical protein
MDPISFAMWIIAGILGITSMFEVGALVYSVKNLSEEKITIKIKNGIKQSLGDEVLQKELIKMMLSKRTTELMSDAIMTRIKAMFDGARGFDEKQKKAFFKTVVEPEEGQVNPIIAMLPKKSQDMITKNPELVQLGMQIAMPLIKEWLGGQLNGSGEVTQGIN